MRNNPMALGIANGVAAGALWGVVFLAPAVLQSFNALQLSAGRYLVYGLIAIALLLPRWKRLAPRLGRAEWFGLLWLSLAGNLVYFLLLATAVQWAGGAAASLIVGLIPVVVMVVVATGAVGRPAMAGAIRLAWAASRTMTHRKHCAPARCRVLRCKKSLRRSSANVPAFGCI